MPSVTVKIPTPLRPFADGHAEVPSDGATVGALVRGVADTYPGLKKHLFTPEGKLRNFVSVYLNDEDVRSLQRDATPVKEGDIVSIVPGDRGRGPGGGPRTVRPEPADRPAQPPRRHPHPRRAPPLQPAPPPSRGRCRRAEAPPPVEGPARRGRGPRRSDGALPRGGRGRRDRPGRFRRDRSFQPSTAGPLHDGRRRPPEARRGEGPSRGPESWGSRRSDRTSIDGRPRARGPAPVRRGRGRHRQLPDPLPRERRLRAPGQTERLRLDLPIRGPGERLRCLERALLPLPLSRAAAPRPRPLVRGGRGPRGPARGSSGSSRRRRP